MQGNLKELRQNGGQSLIFLIAVIYFASAVQVDGTEADLSSVEVLKEPFFSRKLLRLIGILSKFRLKEFVFIRRHYIFYLPNVLAINLSLVSLFPGCSKI